MATTLGERRIERTLDLRTLAEDLLKTGVLSAADFKRLVGLNPGTVHPLVFLADPA